MNFFTNIVLFSVKTYICLFFVIFISLLICSNICRYSLFILINILWILKYSYIITTLKLFSLNSNIWIFLRSVSMYWRILNRWVMYCEITILKYYSDCSVVSGLLGYKNQQIGTVQEDSVLVRWGMMVVWPWVVALVWMRSFGFWWSGLVDRLEGERKRNKG